MNYDISKTFKKEYEKLRNKKLASEILDTIENIENASDIRDIKNLSHIIGNKTAYRIRIGDYRIGVFYENDCIELACFDHRSKIYKRFP